MFPTCHIHVQPDIQILNDLDRFVDPRKISPHKKAFLLSAETEERKIRQPFPSY